MRFKIPSAASELLADPCEPETPPGMRDFISSHVLNDQATSFRAFIENMRHIFNHEEDDGLVLLLSMDENSGNLTMGIARQKRKREESEETTCDLQLQRYLEGTSSPMQNLSRNKTQSSRNTLTGWKWLNAGRFTTGRLWRCIIGTH
jgi:hypothetical protein